MADIGIGALGYVGYAKETVEGTAVAPTKFLTANSITFNDTNDYLTPYVINGQRDQFIAMPAPYNVTGTLEVNLPADDIGYLLKSAFAATVNTSAYAGGGYTHVFTPGNASPTFTFEHAAQDVLFMRHTGVRVNTLNVKAAFGEIVTASFGLDGVDRVKQLTTATPTYAATAPYPFHFNGATVTIAGGANTDVKDWTLNVNNNVSHIGTLRASRAYKRVALGTREITLSLTADFQTTTELDRMLNDTEFTVALYLESAATITGGTGKNSLKFEFPRVKYKAVGLPINAGDFLSQTFECTVLKPSGAAIATVTLVNSESTLA